mgnify:CR=1 FL=1
MRRRSPIFISIKNYRYYFNRIDYKSQDRMGILNRIFTALLSKKARTSHPSARHFAERGLIAAPIEPSSLLPLTFIVKQCKFVVRQRFQHHRKIRVGT